METVFDDQGDSFFACVRPHGDYPHQVWEDNRQGQGQKDFIKMTSRTEQKALNHVLDILNIF